MSDPFDDTQGVATGISGDPFDDTQKALDAETKDAIAKDPRYQGRMKQHISDKMWDGMPFEDARKVYEQLGPYHVDPETGQSYTVPMPTVDPMGTIGDFVKKGIYSVTHPGKPVPEVRPKATNSLGQEILGIGSNILREGGKSALAARESLTGVDQSIEEFETGVPIYPTSGIAKAFQDIAPMIIGGGAGWKVTDKAIKMLPEVGKLAEQSSGILAQMWRSSKTLTKTGAKTAGAGLGEVVAAPEEGGTLVVGNLFNGIEPGDNRADEIVADRINLLADTVITGAGLGTAANGAKLAAGFINEAVIKNVLGILSLSQREEAIVNQMLNSVSAVLGPNTSVTEKDLIKRELIKMVAKPENKELILKMATRGVDDIKITRDTMGALEYALANSGIEDAQKILIRVRQLRQDVVKKGTDELEQVMGLPDQAMDTLSSQTYEAFGGDRGLVEGMKEIQSEGLGEVNLFRNMQGDIQKSLDKETENLQTMLSNDPTFGERLQKLSNRTGVDVSLDKDMTFQEIKDAMEKGVTTVRQKSDELYDAIPDGTLIDPELIEGFLKNDNMTLSKKARSILEKSNGDYKILHNELLPELRKMTTQGLKTGNQDLLDTADDLRNFIYEDAIDYVIDSSDETTEALARAARENYRETVLPWKKGELKNFYDGVTLKNTDQPSGDLKMERSLEKSLTEPVMTKQLTGILSEDYVPVNPKSVRDYTMSKAYQTVLDQLVSGKTVDELDINTIMKSVSSQSRILRENFNEDLANLENFARSYQGKTSDIKGLQDQLKAMTQEVKDAEDRVLGGELKAFFKEVKPGGYVPKPDEDAFKVFSDLLSSGDSVTINNLIKRGQDNPVVSKAMKAAYIKHLRQVTSMGQPGVTGSSRIDINVMKELASKKSPLLEYGDKIFADEPLIPYTTRRLLGESHAMALAARAPTATGQMNVNASDFAKDARKISDFLITLIWGPLSRAGARIRTASSRTIDTADKLQQSQSILDRVYGDPDYFLEIANRILDKGDLARDSGSIGETLAKWYLKTGAYSTVGWDLEQEDLPVLEEEFNRFFEEGGFEQDVPDSSLGDTDEALMEGRERSPFDRLTGQGGPRYQTWPERAVREGASAIRGMMSPDIGEDGLISDLGTDQVIRGATEIGMDVTGANVARHALKGTVPDPNEARIFAGERARTADLNELERAIDMDSTNQMFPDDIWRDTGWFRSDDGSWKFEIPDYGPEVKFNESFSKNLLQETAAGIKQSVPLGNLLEHPKLYDAYPELRAVDVTLSPDIPINNGGFNPTTEEIRIGIKFQEGVVDFTREDIQNVVKATMLHEIQHWVQAKEDVLGKGTSPNYWANFEAPETQARMTTTFSHGIDLVKGMAEILEETPPGMRPKAPSDVLAVVREKYPYMDRVETMRSYVVIPEINDALKAFRRQDVNDDELMELIYKAGGMIQEARKAYEYRKDLAIARSPRGAYASEAGEHEARVVEKRFQAGADREGLAINPALAGRRVESFLRMARNVDLDPSVDYPLGSPYRDIDREDIIINDSSHGGKYVREGSLAKESRTEYNERNFNERYQPPLRDIRREDM